MVLITTGSQGRVYGGSVENGGGRAQKSDDTAKRYDYLQF